MIIDCHTHANNYHNDGTDSLQICLEKLQYEMKKNRIDFAFILTSYKISAGRPSTREVVKATRDIKNLEVIAGISFLHHTPEDLVEIRQYLQEGSVKGMKIYPGYEPFYPTDSRLKTVCTLAEEFHVPLMIHSGDTYSSSGKLKYSHPLHVDELAVDHPEMKIVICHIGNPWIRDCMEVVYKNKNVYTDISGLVLGDFSDRFEAYIVKQLQEMILYGVEPSKVLFGTDWPLSSMESYIDFIEELKIPPKDKEKILWKNAATLFNLSIHETSLKAGTLFNWLQ